MGKIPVIETIRRSYVFAFRRYLPILGAIWLPFLVIGLLAWQVMLPALMQMSAAMVDLARHRQDAPGVPYFPPGFGRAMGGLFLFEAVTVFVALPIVAVGVTRIALGLRARWPFVYVAIGKRELLTAAGILLFGVFYIVGVIVLAGVGVAIGGIVGATMRTSAQSDPAALIATIVLVTRIATFAFLFVIFYFFVRLCYLMVAVTTAEGRFGLWRSWTLTKGNFWRIFAILAATLLPPAIPGYAVWFLVAGPEGFRQMMNLQLHPDPSGMAFAGMVRSLTLHALPVWILLFLMAPISYGLMFGQSAFAYRALVPATDDEFA